LDVQSDQMPKNVTLDLIHRAEVANQSGFQVELSGFAIRDAQQGDFSSEGLGLLVAAVILLFTFGSLLAAGLPLLIAVFGLGIATAMIGIFALVLQVPNFAPQVAAMIGIGVGIDYVLFILTRYRTELHHGLTPADAVVRSISTAGRAVMFAGITVIISLL